mmetsp:Transcript_293/g.516  ORF Transcript_293/g.516 Transcript_293/m.516 type:complete len:159 (-) Transcript_293:732-1208(-)
MACKREATEADIIDSSVVDVNLLLGLKRKPVSQQNVVKIKAMFAAERKEKKKEKHVPRNPYVTINNIHHTVSMYDNVGTIIDGISSSLSEKMEGTCRKELRDLKRVSNVMTVMAESVFDFSHCIGLCQKTSFLLRRLLHCLFCADEQYVPSALEPNDS